MKKTARIPVRSTEQNKKKLIIKAEKLGLKLSPFLVMAGLKYKD